MRTAARIDANQHELVQALRKVGAKCFYIKEPVDLVVGFRGRSILLEIKRPGKPMTVAQKDFVDTWPGEVHVVYSVHEAISAVVWKAAA